MKYRRRPEDIHATKWEGPATDGLPYLDRVRPAYPTGTFSDEKCDLCDEFLALHGIFTDECGHELIVCPGDWVIMDSWGEVAVFEPHEFNERFEPIREADSKDESL